MNSVSRGYVVKMLITLILTGVTLFSDPVAALAKSPADSAKAANTMIREAEKNMFRGKIEQAAKLLDEARAELDALAGADPSYSQLKGLESKYNRIKKQVDKKLSSGTAKAPAAPAMVQTSKSSGDKLPAGVSKRIKDINRELDKVDRYLSKGNEASAKQADYILNGTQGLFDEINTNYGSQFAAGHPDYVAVKNRFATLKEKAVADISAAGQKKIENAKAMAEKESQSAEWISKFQAYLSYPGAEGHNPDMLVYVPGTSEPEKFSDALKRYDSLKAFLSSYKKAEFPSGKSEALEQLGDEEAPRRLADFENQFKDRVNAVTGDAEKQISQAMAQLEKDTTWKSDTSAKPPIVDKKWMDVIDTQVKKVNSALGADNTDAVRISKSYTALIDKDKAHRKIRAERTFLSSDIYEGADKKDLLKIANDIVVKEKPGSTALSISIYKAAWQEKTEEGWTDTTKTRWEKKTFRQINAQVGARDASGVYCHTLYLAEDKTTSGWGNVYGHIMFSDPMVEKNIGK